jgi:hypothetical protein
MNKAVRQIGFYAGMLLIVSALYVLSIGPATRVWNISPFPQVRTAIEVAYYPLLLLQISGADGGFMSWYVQLWTPNY